MRRPRILQWFHPSSKHHGEARRSKLPERPLHLEFLEDRCLLSILFDQGVGTTVSDHNPGQARGPVITNAQVQLIFWGSLWNSEPYSTLRTDVSNAVNSILSGPYTRSLAQYGGAGRGSVVNTLTISTSSPPTRFVSANVRNMLISNINSSDIPYGNYLYMVIPQPFSTDPTENLGGAHAVAAASGNRSFYYGWTENVGGAGALDDITYVFSHEYAEAVTEVRSSPSSPLMVSVTALA